MFSEYKLGSSPISRVASCRRLTVQFTISLDGFRINKNPIYLVRHTYLIISHVCLSISGCTKVTQLHHHTTLYKQQAENNNEMMFTRVECN